jgi:galactonate dehydratase
MDRRTFTKALAAGVLGTMGAPGRATALMSPMPQLRTPAWLEAAEAALPPAIVTGIRIFDPPNPNYLRRVNESNLVIMVDTDIGITGVGQGGSPDLIAGLARSVIGKNAFDTERIWQYMYMDAFYSPGREKIHAVGAIDMALWDIKGKALNVPLYQFFGGKVRDHVELYATPGLPGGVVAPGEAARMSLGERAVATMEAGYRVYRIDAEGTGPYGQAGILFGGPLPGRVWDARARIPPIERAAREIREAIGDDGNWMIDLHQKFDFQDSLDCCRRIEDYRPYMVEDPLREEQFLTQIPKLRMLTICPLAPGEQWGQRWTFNTLVENRDIDWIRATLPTMGGFTEMLKIMAICETHTVGIAPHHTNPIATAALVHALTAYPGLALMEYNLGSTPPAYTPELVDFHNGKLWPNDRPGLGVTLEPSLLTRVQEFTEGTPGPGGSTYHRPDGSPTHW